MNIIDLQERLKDFPEQALMQEIKRDGTLARIFRRYVSAEEVSKMLDF